MKISVRNNTECIKNARVHASGTFSSFAHPQWLYVCNGERRSCRSTNAIFVWCLDLKNIKYLLKIRNIYRYIFSLSLFLFLIQYIQFLRLKSDKKTSKIALGNNNLPRQQVVQIFKRYLLFAVIISNFFDRSLSFLYQLNQLKIGKYIFFKQTWYRVFERNIINWTLWEGKPSREI